jgi:hypothetical protein
VAGQGGGQVAGSRTKAGMATAVAAYCLLLPSLGLFPELVPTHSWLIVRNWVQ